MTDTSKSFARETLDEIRSKLTDTTPAAVLDLCGPEPLVWQEQVTDCICTSNPDYTLKYWLIEDVWVMRRHKTLEAAQAAAQSLADAAHWGNTKLGDMTQ